MNVKDVIIMLLVLLCIGLSVARADMFRTTNVVQPTLASSNLNDLAVARQNLFRDLAQTKDIRDKYVQRISAIHKEQVKKNTALQIANSYLAYSKIQTSA